MHPILLLNVLIQSSYRLANVYVHVRLDRSQRINSDFQVASNTYIVLPKVPKII